jgi:leucyl aminopeptidase
MTVMTEVPTLDVSLYQHRAVECEVEFVAVPVFEDDDLADVGDLDAATGGDARRSLTAKEFSARPFELYATRLDARAPRLLCVGAGPRQKLTIEGLRRIATTAAWAVRQRGGRSVAFVLRQDRDLVADARAAAEGLVLAALGVDQHKTTPRQIPSLDRAVVIASGVEGLEAAVELGATLGHSTNIARRLSDQPGNALTPSKLAQAARTILDGSGIEVEILEPSQLATLKMGLLLAVGQGSAAPPRLIVMRYRPASAATGRMLGLVGKGVTFDSGGISIKPAEHMDRMKHDMSGGAAVIAAMHAIAKLQLSVPVLGIVPTVENMPSDRALKPGDIVTGASGKTVEVLNTDAEGRLILGDSLWFARQQGATHLVDVATLTGACVIALGKVCSGLFGTPGPWVETVRQAAERAGERLWPLPVDDDYLDLLKSDYADMTNTGGRAGGAIGGAMFLREFAGEGPWAHLDIAGTAWAEDAKPWQPKGATGVTVRTLVELAMSADRWLA